MPEVTVFVLSVDSARMLEDALDCVAAQTFHDVEIFVVEHADEPAAPPRPGVGVVQASSSLIPWTSTGSAPWIAFLRSDDRWRPRALERVLRRLHLAHETAAAGPEADLSTLVIRRDTLADLGGVSHWPETREAARELVRFVSSRCAVTDVTGTLAWRASRNDPAATEHRRVDMVHDTAYWRLRRTLANTAHAVDGAVARALRGKRKRVLFEAASPLSVSVFQPVLNRLRQDDLVDVWFTSADRAWTSREIFSRLGPGERIVAPAVARLMKFDGYINTDFWNTTWLPRRTRRFHFFHGVAGKYGLDAPVQIAPVVSAFDRLLFPNMDRLRRYEDAGLVAAEGPQAALIGYPKVDCLVDGSLDRATIQRQLGLDPSCHTVLYAPTWSPHSSLQTHGLSAIRSLAANGFNVIVKLHDRSYERGARGSGGIDWQAALGDLARQERRLYVADDADASRYLYAADALVTDHSSIGFEFMLLDRPLVVIDCPGLVEKARISPDKVRLLRRAAAVVESGSETAEAAARELADAGRLGAERRRIAAELFYRAGSATARAVHCLYEALEVEAPAPLPRAAARDRFVLGPAYQTAALHATTLPGRSEEAAVSAFRP